MQWPCSLGPCQPEHRVIAVVGKAGAMRAWGFRGRLSCSASPPGRVNPALPTASSGCRWLPASGVGASVRRPFLNLSHSGSFLFLLRKICKGNCCLNEGLVRGGEQSSLLLQREENTTWLLLQTKQGWKQFVWLLEMVSVLGLISQPLKSLEKFMALLS